MSLVFVDVEASGPCPGLYRMTEFAAIIWDKNTRERTIFHGKPDLTISDPDNTIETWKRDFYRLQAFLFNNITDHPVMVSDNPAFDFQWINYYAWYILNTNPFGHSARRISDFYAGLCGDFHKSQQWKRLRVTKHDHNPVNDTLGNIEAFERMLDGER